MQPKREQASLSMRGLAGKATCGLVGSLAVTGFGSLVPAKAITYIPAFTLVPDPPACKSQASCNLITPAGDFVLGYHFDIDITSQLKAIGLYKPTLFDHTVGIWDANNYSDANPVLGALIWQTTVGSQDTCDRIGSYCFIATPSGPMLQGNHKYVVASTWGQESVPYKLSAGQFVPESGFRVGRVANSAEVFDGLTVDLSDPTIATDYTPNLSDPLSPIGYMTVNLSFKAINEVPGPLPLFGAAAAFGWSRKFRGRIKSAS